MQFNNDNAAEYTRPQIEMMNTAFDYLAREHPEWTAEYLRDQIKKAWVSDDTLNTPPQLVDRVNRDQYLEAV